MKGTICIALKHMVVDRIGADGWTRILARAHVADDVAWTHLLLMQSDASDAQAVAVFKAAAAELDLTWESLCTNYGEWWMNHHVRSYYMPLVSKYPDARTIVKNLTTIHDRVTKMMKNARPPKFEVTVKSENVYSVKYISHRGLVDLAAGLIRGVGAFVKEDVAAHVEAKDTIRVVFGSPAASSAP